jgi:hypothetical protein
LYDRQKANSGAWSRTRPFVSPRAGAPPVRILDRSCEELRHRRNTAWSRASAIVAGTATCGRPSRASGTPPAGLDREGRVLLVHTRAPYTRPRRRPADLPLDLRRLSSRAGRRRRST